MNIPIKFFSYFVIAALLLAASFCGCGSSQQEERRAEQIKNMRNDIEKLKELNKQADASLDSLYRELRRKDEELKLLQLEIDSLQKNIGREQEK